MSLLTKVKDALGKRFLIMYGNPAYWDRPVEREQYMGLPNGETRMKYDEARVARGYPHLEFDTSFYTRENFVPPVLPGGSTKEPALLLNPVNNSVQVPQHFPVPHWHKNKALLDAKMETLLKYGVVTAGVYRFPEGPSDYPVFGIDSDYLYFHD